MHTHGKQNKKTKGKRLKQIHRATFEHDVNIFASLRELPINITSRGVSTMFCYTTPGPLLASVSKKIGDTNDATPPRTIKRNPTKARCIRVGTNTPGTPRRRILGWPPLGLVWSTLFTGRNLNSTMANTGQTSNPLRNNHCTPSVGSEMSQQSNATHQWLSIN